jgi:hypothetical protein
MSYYSGWYDGPEPPGIEDGSWDVCEECFSLYKINDGCYCPLFLSAEDKWKLGVL